MSLEDLKQAYDAAADNTVIGLGFLRDEIVRREQEAQTQKIIAFTRQMRNMTIAIMVLTVLNVILVAISLCK